MLNIYFGDKEGSKYIYNPDSYFDHWYDPNWLVKDLSKEIIKAVDKSEVIGPNLIQSPVFGAMSPDRLSGGTKTLILIDNDNEHIFNATHCGNNCAPYLLKIAENKDVTVTLEYIMDFGTDFEIKILNTGNVVNNFDDYFREARIALRGE
ncbi:DUF4869 domain-containing protein [Peptacetobacter sp. AB845]|uniref:DUF4869 domain-containing protein n=1 Tax=Peptacetobacter sp. AB845 TaxID=3388429 RepID=UPI0039C8EE5B